MSEATTGGGQGYLGMDPEAVRALAAQLMNGAGQVRDLCMMIASQIEATAWTGQDREMFLSDWRGTHTQQLEMVAVALESASERANSNASAQEAASAA